MRMGRRNEHGQSRCRRPPLARVRRMRRRHEPVSISGASAASLYENGPGASGALPANGWGEAMSPAPARQARGSPGPTCEGPMPTTEDAVNPSMGRGSHTHRLNFCRISQEQAAGPSRVYAAPPAGHGTGWPKTPRMYRGNTHAGACPCRGRTWFHSDCDQFSCDEGKAQLTSGFTDA